MDKIKNRLYQSGEFQRLVREVRELKPGKSLAIHGVAGSLLAFVAARAFEERQSQLLLVASDEDRAEKLRDDCALVLGEGSVRFFGARPSHRAQVLDMTSSISQIETLKALTDGPKFLVVASPHSVAEKVPPPLQFSQTIIEMTVGSDFPFQRLIVQLEQIGFERKEFVESYGDFSVRGGIIDVFPYVGENPIRLEFWGDTIESIREFDVLSQRSIRELQLATVVPSLSSPNAPVDEVGGANQSPQASSLLDYLQKDASVILDEPEIIRREIEELFKEGATNLFSHEEFFSRVAKFSILTNSLLGADQSAIPPAVAGQSPISFGSASQPSFNGSINRLVEMLGKLTSDGYSIFLTSDTAEETERLRELTGEAATEEVRGSRSEERETGEEAEIGDLDSPPPGRLNAPGRQIPDGAISDRRPLEPMDETGNRHPTSAIRPIFLNETVHSGFIDHPAKIAVLTEHEIFGRLRRRGLAKRRRFKGFSQKEMQQLKRGDYVVHIDHGIGTFGGLTKIRVGGVEQEAMKLLFLENDVLYVNLNFINRVQKYASQEGHIPKLNRLGAPDWERAKAKAKRRIKDIARDIIALYARRKHEKGFTFSPDTHWQKELEASFMFDDTPDQAAATLDVKRDMESPAPMDRLVCGDVGFGKTEVALRAAFKSVMDGKQVALLVPTTILALQHSNTFQDRLSRYTTRVENITRFKSKSEQAGIVEELKRGSIDIIIGTHRLLSRDIGFKDLGLLIIDEEHRFGVTAKEKLRQLKATVDTLTLTATPIPRTLHFSLIGARDLSLINTPPRNRLPIATEIIAATDGRQTHWQIIREAILKELHRGGQVFFVHDRVQNIDAVADQVRGHVPEARVRVAHGQMKGHQLERAMLEFLERKFEVLVATKIIESGLDIPSVNTIIVNRADRFGLAELYQLRGRVGRSNTQAYAYLLVPPLSQIPKYTLRRLQAIEEFTELGSGFNLAMRDLEIRGAGNIFGAEQSGTIMEMGFEMYERIVSEAVEELKQEEFKEDFRPIAGRSARTPTETVIDSDIDALIPDFYIESDAERLDIYRRLYRAGSEEELRAMRDELRDRFGDYPEEVENLFHLVGLRLLATHAGFSRLVLKGETLTITLPPQSDERFYGSLDSSATQAGKPDAPFQRIMKNISEGKRREVWLKQTGADLLLQFAPLPGVTAVQRLSEARKKIDEFGLFPPSPALLPASEAPAAGAS